MLTAALVAMLLRPMASSPYPSPSGLRSYTNPVYAHNFPDPHVIRVGGKFYAYATESGKPGFQAMESEDLVHWTHRGVVFLPEWSASHRWAPEVVFHRGRYYMTYSATNPRTRKHDIGVAVADKPLGPFKDLAILVPGDRNKVGVIDTTVFFDGGKPYLLYSEEEPRRIVARRLSENLEKTAGPPVELIRPDHPWERGVTEAPTMVLRDGTYWLIYSCGWYQSNKDDACYAVAAASAPALFGPYKKKSKPLLQTVPDKVYGPGHQCVIDLPSGETWMLYHGWDNQNQPRYGSNPLGRTLRIDRVFWAPDGPRMDGPSTDPRPVPRIR